MSQQPINAGTTPNDGTGDTLRAAMIKANTNFTELYTNPILSTSLSVGNSSVNTYVNSTAITTGGLTVGPASGYNFSGIALAELQGSQNTYVEVVSQNANTGNNASTDLVLTADSGNDSVNYVDLGINGSGYNQTAYNIGGALDAYLYASNSNIHIGTAANNGQIVFHANGTTSSDLKMTINATAVGIANNVALVVGNSTVNAVTTPTQRTIANSIASLTATPTSISVGNSTVNASVNTTVIFVGNSTTSTFVNNGLVQTTNGMYSIGQFNGTFSHGIVVDYVAGNGRISTGPADQLTFYTGGVGTTQMLQINATVMAVNTYIQTGAGGGSATGGVTVNASAVIIGNSTVNVSTNSTHFFAGNSTYYGFGNSTAEALVAPNANLTFYTNTSSGYIYYSLGNSTVYATGNSVVEQIFNTSVNTSISIYANGWNVGNSTVNAYGNSSMEVLANTSGNINITPLILTINVAAGNTGSVIVGNTISVTTITQASANIGNTLFTVNATALSTPAASNTSLSGNTLYVNSTAVVVSTNTLNVGTSTKAANGYTWLPNGLKMNWGWVSSNSTVGAVTFTSAFATNAYVVTATSNTATATYQAGVTAWVGTGATILTTNVTSTNVFWTAIGA